MLDRKPTYSTVLDRLPDKNGMVEFFYEDKEVLELLGQRPLVGRASGVLSVAEPGHYRIRIRVDDGVRLRVAESIVHDNYDLPLGDENGRNPFHPYRRELWLDEDFALPAG